MAKVADRICQAARDNRAELIVVGLPRNMDGTEGARAQKSRKLAALVEQASGLPVRMWDERQTTITRRRLSERERHLRQKAQSRAGRGERLGDPGKLPGLAQKPSRRTVSGPHG